MEETISLQEIFKIIKKRLVHIISITIVAAIIAGVISFYLLTPIYQASTQILVNQEQTTEQQTVQTQDIQANLQLINTYNVIIKSPAILSIVIDRLDLSLSPDQLSNKITVSSQDNSQVVNISVQDENAAIAVEIANTTAEVFEIEIQELMNVNNVNILSSAVLGEDPSPIKPNKMLNIAIGAVIGLMIGLGLAFLIEYMDTTIKTEQDVEDILGLPIIGLVSKIPDDEPLASTDKLSRSRRK
ncbi:YveK family protein [Ureibacillus aquaedulcis]|uniref:Wzz/FepE/Etk N-terminal domain-containing protein n=1 Tax=Ureibacillus aquaedulcis TaxID=3058421 RepID=A0ABT8GUR5_9BACL|nr:Wzz/FepE/Etk N-terminal domain-containing protein [Ureibacillus sp. BA0131]MDN4495155.1 Wzz/FepE/Etk N-terminal domain-containing protein [Ureibacillus sp. BA0131]